MLSQTAGYALRAVVHLAEVESRDPQRVSAISECLDVPQNYLSKILHTLARKGVLNSARGPRGGFVLAIPAEELTLARVVQEFDTTLADRACLLGRPECRDDAPCPAHDRWAATIKPVREFLEETRVSDLIAQSTRTPEAGS